MSRQELTQIKCLYVVIMVFVFFINNGGHLSRSRYWILRYGN